MTIECTVPRNIISSHVKLALDEDIGQQDLTADLISINAQATATIITREDATLCGQAWLNDVFTQLDPAIKIHWYFADGDRLKADDVICQLDGPAKTLLTGERTAMNFIQTLSATATHAQRYADEVQGLAAHILDTRKTIPGLRTAQKYAVATGGCDNHRIGLFDAFLIKENHIAACGGITQAVNAARKLAPEKPIEVEVETIQQLIEAESSKADIIMLDNFSEEQLEKIASIDIKHAKIELSGNISLDNHRSGNHQQHI
ncbi:MAG: nicotinate-nucleotide diphosphorylase (carboxylating), partial [Gammaproteobacteria bacterium]